MQGQPILETRQKLSGTYVVWHSQLRVSKVFEFILIMDFSDFEDASHSMVCVNIRNSLLMHIYS